MVLVCSIVNEDALAFFLSSKQNKIKIYYNCIFCNKKGQTRIYIYSMYFNVNSMRHMSHFFLPLVYRIHHSVGYALHTPEHDMAHWWRGGGQRSTKYDAGTRIAVQIQTKGENYR